MDRFLLEHLNAMVTWPGVGPVVGFIHEPASILCLAAVVLLWAGWRRRPWDLLWGALAVGAADLVTVRLLKPLVARPRPCAGLEDVLAPFGCGAGWSMPSAHAANIFALAVAIGAPWAWGLAAVVAVSRVVAGVHYPSDVVVGAGVGVAFGLTIRCGGRALLRRRRHARGGGAARS